MHIVFDFLQNLSLVSLEQGGRHAGLFIEKGQANVQINIYRHNVAIMYNGKGTLLAV